MWRGLGAPLLLLALLLQCSAPALEPSCSSPCGADANVDRGYDAQSYELIARFDWTSRRLVAHERIRLIMNARSTVVDLDAAVDVKSVRGAPAVNATGTGSAETGATFANTTALPPIDAGTRGLRFVRLGDVLRIDVAPLGVVEGPLELSLDYEAPLSDALRTSAGRDDDPVTTRVVYTDSEPFAGMYWLPANHEPTDRATWNIELTVGPGEDVIANGARIRDETVGGGRVVRYEMADPIPTYTMAFAAGEIEHRDDTTGRVPLSVWYRRGLLLDAEAMLEFVSTTTATFERLIGPYPFASYAVVLLPEFSGGMENTTITFTAETSGQGNLDTSLQAHELAHQWFGDEVTMTTFDDVWIKEGMATLLAAEAERAPRDVEKKGRLFGSTFGFDPERRIRDRALRGLSKYTSGPYTRAAWLLTQIRAEVGEARFWAALRNVLALYRWGNVDSETFLRSFGLDEAATRAALHSLDERRVPAIAIDVKDVSGGSHVALRLTDPGATLLAPLSITVVDAEGRARSHALTPDHPLELEVPAGGYLAPDEGDVHPDWRSFRTAEGELLALAPLFFPGSPAARAAFATRSAAHQERALDAILTISRIPDIAPADFVTIAETLDSSSARRSAELVGCLAIKNRRVPAWGEALAPLLRTPSFTIGSSAHANCQTEIATNLFGAELASFDTSVDAAHVGRWIYLSSFDYGGGATLDALSTMATQGKSLQLREQALTRLSNQAVPDFGYLPLTVDEATRYKEFFRARLAESRSSSRFQLIWRAVVGLADDGALPVAAQKLHTLELSDDLRRQIVCDARAIAKGSRADAWGEFQRAARPWETLGTSAQQALATACEP